VHQSGLLDQQLLAGLLDLVVQGQYSKRQWVQSFLEDLLDLQLMKQLLLDLLHRPNREDLLDQLHLFHQ
jgi:hypothetical protein